MSHWFGKRHRSDGSVRRSQLLTTAGPGALIDLVRHAAIVGGLDAWRFPNDQEGFLSEPRLQARAERLLRGLPWWTSSGVRLRTPPFCDDDRPLRSAGIQAARFPGWYLCQNPECRSLFDWRGLERERHLCTTRRGQRPMPVVPVRFVTACPDGHIQDVPWVWFVHRGRTQEGHERDPADPESLRRFCRRTEGRSGRPNDPLAEDWQSDLYFQQVGTSGELQDYLVGCRACGVRRGLQDLAIPDALGPCPGWRPWLGIDAREPGCSHRVRLITRTASNAYFPQVLSALSIPDPAERVRHAVERAWDVLRAAPREHLAVLRQVPLVRGALGDLSDDAVWEEIERRQLGRPVDVPPVREAEWQALMEAPFEAPGDRPAPHELWFARRLEADLPDLLDRVVLVHHLREVRAQIGFTRIDGVSGDAEGEYELDVRTAPLSRDQDWIPAVEILGEGVLLAFDLARIRAWEAEPAVEARAARFREALFLRNAGRARQAPDPGIRLVMLHTLSHLLITAISLECGYPATSIRERIYCATGEVERAGILLYTGTPGSEGTLGGLVEVGRRVVHHLRRAAEAGRLCSNDPVCAQHNPADAQEGRDREGAACHGCVLIGEPSCERRNRDLDRTLVVPTVESGDAAFLGPWMQTWT